MFPAGTDGESGRTGNSGAGKAGGKELRSINKLWRHAGSLVAEIESFAVEAIAISQIMIRLQGNERMIRTTLA
jgi:hypothetical protein